MFGSDGRVVLTDIKNKTHHLKNKSWRL